MIPSIDDIDVGGRRVLTRVDVNVPQHDDGSIADATRIEATLPTIRAIVGRGGIAVLMSHLGRPKGAPDKRWSLRPVADWLRDHAALPGRVIMADDCVGDAAATAVADARAGDVVLLENLRFHAGEEANDPAFCSALATLGDLYCNDAFGTAHRAHASTAGVAALFAERCAGLLMRRELDYLGTALTSPRRPLVAIMGGSKISGKIDVIRALLGRCDTILIGGGMMFTFLAAQGRQVGSSLVEADRLDLARTLIDEARTAGVDLVIPVDTVVADRFAADAATRTVSVEAIDDGWMGLDIGPETVARFTTAIAGAGTVVWNGPMGVFEFPAFAAGTRAVSEAMVAATERGAVTIVGGGDSAAAITSFGLAHGVSHVSTGGGASLEFLEGRTLPGVAALA